jgi:hypothetical protein
MSEHTEFTVHHLRFEVEARTPLLLPAHAGPSIRGALWGALRHHFCPASEQEVPPPEHAAHCPVCWLMATDKPDHPRGRDVPRPYTVEPPVDSQAGWQARRFEPGQRFAFGLTLFARALNLFPFLVVAAPLMGQAGIGTPLEENTSRPGQARRGRFVLRRIDAVNPLTGALTQVLGEGQTLVHVPDVPVTAADVAAASRGLLDGMAADGRLDIRFWTPTRLVEAERLVRRPWLGPLFRRLLERLDALRGEYAAEPPVPDRQRLQALADGVRLVRDHTRWLEVQSGSRRLGRATPVSGYVGLATYQADRETWKALLPYLLWGQEVHVGKNATKGDGWYELRAAAGG